jgi:hypothetical protein
MPRRARDCKASRTEQHQPAIDERTKFPYAEAAATCYLLQGGTTPFMRA